MGTAAARHIGRALIFGLLVPSAVVGQQHFPADDDLELMLRFLVEDGEAPAAALGIVEADGSTSVVTYGDAGPGGRPLGPGSVFELGEVTMTFTATLLADMVARGEVSLDDPVSRYLPEGVVVPSLSGYEITLGHLAEHKSGLPPAPPEPVGEFTVDDLYALLGDYELDWVPGRSRELSLVGYGLLGHALARAAGTTYGALLRERVLGPLGMERTGYALEGPIGDRAVRGHDGGEAVEPTVVTEALQGATGLRTSAEDATAFLAANALPAETPLQEAMAEAHEVRTPWDPEGEGYGYSWRTYAQGRMPLLVTHGGRTAGFTSLISFDPERRLGTVLLASSRDFNDWAARDLLYTPAPSQRPEAEVDRDLLRTYVGGYVPRGGSYRAGPRRAGLFIRLEEEGYLTYQPRDRTRARLYAVSDSSFYMLRAPLTVAFDRTGDRVQMVLRVDDRDPRLQARTWRRWKLNEDVPPPEVVAGNAGISSTWGTGVWILIALAGAVVALLVLRPAWSGLLRGR